MFGKKIINNQEVNGRNHNDLQTRKIFQNSFVIISIIMGIGLYVRFTIFPYEVPFTLDALDYFSYAGLTSQLGQFPDDVLLANNGWSGFVSIFFSLLDSESFFDYVHLQRLLGIIISVFTIIPVYLLSRQFFPKLFAYIASALFVLEPRIIINSVSGGSHPLFIFLITLSVFMFLTKNNKLNYTSFGVLSLACIIRYEALVLFIPFFIMYFFRTRRQKNIILRYFLVVSIVILVLLPIASQRIEKTGEDGLISNLFAGVQYLNNHVITSDNTLSEELLSEYHHPESSQSFIISGFQGMVKHLLWMTFPMFMFFLPISIFIIFKNRDFRKLDNNSITIIVIGIFLLIPAFYMYARDFQETRYLFALIPIIILFSTYSLKIIKIKKQELHFIIVFLGVLLLSISAISYKDLGNEYEHERESFEISKFVINNAEGINYFQPESRFVKSAEAYKTWPDILEFDFNGHVIRETKLFKIKDLHSIEDFIENSQMDGLSHVIVDKRSDTSKIKKDIFYFEEKYPYLIKQFDSKEVGFEHHVKIFKIDYNIFNNLEN